MSEVFVGSDHHAGHSNIMKHCSRREFMSPDELLMLDRREDFKVSQDSVERMNTGIISAINSVVSRQDILYILGDFVMSRGEAGRILARRMRAKINCSQVHLILGNHDISWYSSSVANLFASVEKMKTIRVDGQKIIMCHYPLRSWESSSHGSFMLHGHSHCTMPEELTRLSFDVGVDGAHGFAPWSFDEISEVMRKKLAYIEQLKKTYDILDWHI
jgi:calcineurin-like phosphoesterase family protein